MSSIQTYVDELRSINNDLKSLRIKSSQLRNRAKIIEKQINEYLTSKDQPGLKYKGVAILKEIKTSFKPKNKAEQKADCLEILERYGIRSPERVLDEINYAKKGSPIEKTKLQIKKYKNKE